MASSATSIALSFLLLLLLLLIISFVPLHAASSSAGFSVELMHRDHPDSPLYDPSSTPFDRAMAAARRSRLRVQQMAARSGTSVSLDSVDTEITPDFGGEYLMTYEVGTPPVEILAIFDTGSDLTWTSCKPCGDCYPQDAPLFDPSGSSTYRNLACGTDPCNVISSSRCNDQGACEFHYFYGGGSDLNATLATETIGFATTEGGKAAFPDYTLACAFRTGGPYPRTAAGIVGLSPGAISMITQVGFTIGRKFSYCLPPNGNPQLKTKLNFGDAAVVPAGAAVTPLVLDNFFYAVILQEIVVGDKTIPVPPDAAGHGNIIVDSGTTMTFLVPAVLQQVADAVAELVRRPRSTDSKYGHFGVCFQDQGPPDGWGYPGMTLKFDAGATVQLLPINVFTKPGADVVCLAIMSPAGNRMFLGNVALQNMHVVNDLDQSKLSFAPADCSNA